MSIKHYAIEATYLLIVEAYQIISINVKLEICLVLSGEALEGCEEEHSFWKLYIQLVFGTNFMLCLRKLHSCIA